LVAESLLVIASAILLFGAISLRAERSVLSPPMFFIAVGCLVSAHGLGLLHVEIASESVHVLAEVTLVVILFTDASRIDLGLLCRERGLPIRLLGIGLPLTIGLGTVVALWVFRGQFSWPEAALLAAILAPTDAALGQAVVSSSLVPARIRRTLNVESGLNDGIVLPLVLMLASTASAMAGGGDPGEWLRRGLLAVVVGTTVGGAVGYLGAKGLETGVRKAWINASFERLSSLGLAFLAFAAAELAGGNGFISAFVAGLVLGNIGVHVRDIGETEGQLLTLLVFLVFGAVMIPELVEHWHPINLIYALLSLTVIRMLPVALSLIGSGLFRASYAFLGWFGPRGLASILFVLLVVEEGELAAGSAIQSIVMLTVLLSALLHGATAYPLARRYGAYVGKRREAAERIPVEEHRVRLRHTGG
jgi:NhaP-type Na+/H+ or K+/H+ antiporter